jgi:uncharacterized protein (DUF2141 family)
MRVKWFLVKVTLFISIVYPIVNEAHSLTIKVDKLQNSKGVVQFSIYNTENSIPDMNFEKYLKKGIAIIHDKSANFTFENLPSGKYAINILHDENNNGKIDKGFMFPIEGVGFSNINKLGLLDKPNFIKSSFELKSDSTLTIKIIYM